MFAGQLASAFRSPRLARRLTPPRPFFIVASSAIIGFPLGIGRRVFEALPSTIDFVLSADDHFIGIAIHVDEAFGFFNLLRQLVDGHGLELRWWPQPYLRTFAWD